MFLGDDDGMAFAVRLDVEKGERIFVFMDNMRRDFFLDNLTEDAVVDFLVHFREYTNGHKCSYYRSCPLYLQRA